MSKPDIRSDIQAAEGHGSAIAQTVGNILDTVAQSVALTQTNIVVVENMKTANDKAASTMKSLGAAMKSDSKNVSKLGLDYQEFDEEIGRADNILSDASKQFS